MVDIVEIGNKFGVNLTVDESLNKYSKTKPPYMEEIEKILRNSRQDNTLGSFKKQDKNLGSL